ncbi:MAG: hypothetical protein ACE5E5_15205, partial [Phycisphaerae bacterium]
MCWSSTSVSLDDDGHTEVGQALDFAADAFLEPFADGITTFLKELGVDVLSTTTLRPRPNAGAYVFQR